MGCLFYMLYLLDHIVVETHEIIKVVSKEKKKMCLQGESMYFMAMQVSLLVIAK